MRRNMTTAQRRRANLKAAGMCICCGQNAAEPNRNYCATCLATMRRARAKKRALWKADGRCLICGCPADGRAQCPRCAQRSRVFVAQYQQKGHARHIVGAACVGANLFTDDWSRVDCGNCLRSAPKCSSHPDRHDLNVSY